MQTPSLSNQKIAAILKKAGFVRAEWIKSSRVKGWGRWMKGFDIKEINETKFEERPVPRSRMRWRDGVRVGPRTEVREVKVRVEYIEIGHIVGEHYRVDHDPSPEQMLKKYQAALDAAGFRAEWIEPRTGIRGAHLRVTVWERARFTTDGLRYEEACKLIAECEKAGVLASVVPGGIGFYPETRDAEHVMFEICSKYKVVPVMGRTAHEDNILLKAAE